MTTYVVTLKSTGAEVYRYNSDAPVEWAGMEFATHDHAAQIEVVEPVATPTVEWPNAMAFLLMFTPVERITAREARKTDLVLNDFFCLLELAPTVRNDDPNVQAGLGYMAQQGYLAAARAGEILNG